MTFNQMINSLCKDLKLALKNEFKDCLNDEFRDDFYPVAIFQLCHDCLKDNGRISFLITNDLVPINDENIEEDEYIGHG